MSVLFKCVVTYQGDIAVEGRTQVVVQVLSMVESPWYRGEVTVEALRQHGKPSPAPEFLTSLIGVDIEDTPISAKINHRGWYWRLEAESQRRRFET